MLFSQFPIVQQVLSVLGCLLNDQGLGLFGQRPFHDLQSLNRDNGFMLRCSKHGNEADCSRRVHPKQDAKEFADGWHVCSYALMRA